MIHRDLDIINNLLNRTDNLHEIFHLRTAEIGYEFTEEEDKATFLDTYEKLDDILKEIAAFINVKFPGSLEIAAWITGIIGTIITYIVAFQIILHKVFNCRTH